MKVSELLNEIKEQSDYFPNSLYLKSSDNYGCVYKWLINQKEFASRQELFIALNPDESELNILDKTVIDSIKVEPPK